MVFFTCNICGDSVKKPAVAKHYNTKCRGAPKSVSCMDCQKDFKGEDYVEHTSCITEAEKYSGKDYVPKPSQNAGLKKQQCWLEIVRSILSATDIQMTGEVRRTLQRLQIYDNVPRKQHKFVNFVVNSLRIKPSQAEPVWKVVEVALEKYKEVRFGSKKTDEDKSKTVNENAKTEEINGNSEEATHGNEENENGKKKKKGKRAIADDQEIKETVAEETNDEAPKKKKKKSKDKENGQDELIMENGVNCVEENSGSSKKKKKRSSDTENDVPNGVESVKNDDDPPKKKKKKTSEPVEAENETIEIDSNTTTQAPPAPFDWTHEIHSLVEKKKEMKVEKLKSRVLKKYQKLHQIDKIPWKVEKTFNKKLGKSGLLIVDDIVKTSI